MDGRQLLRDYAREWLAGRPGSFPPGRRELTRNPPVAAPFGVADARGWVDIKKLSVSLGHGSAGFTLATYTHLTESADIQARQAIEAALAAEALPLRWTRRGYQG